MLSSSTIDTRTQRYTRLTLDGVELLLPQTDIVNLVHPKTIQYAAQSGRIGVLSFHDGLWPVYRFGPYCELSTETSDSDEACVVLGHHDDYFAVLCKAVHTIPSSELSWRTVPECMQQAALLSSVLALHMGMLYCLTSSADLQRFITWRRAESHAE